MLSDEEPYSYDMEGYIIKRPQFLMILNLDSCSFETNNRIIKCVKTEEEARLINHVFNNAAIDLKKLDDPNLHFYFVAENGCPVSHGSYVLPDTTVF